MADSDGIAEIRAAEEAATLQRGLLEQLEVAETNQAAARQRLGDAAATLATEQGDVDRLENLSMARILAAVKGSRDTDRERERSEARAAEYAVAEATERLRAAEAEVAAIERQLAELGDVAAQERAAVEMRERALLAAGGEAAERLTELARDAGAATGHQQQLDEAIRACRAADASLREAAGLLGKAQSWAAWDTFGGGGLLTDAIKYDRLDKAAELMRVADAALVHLSRELADVNVAGVGRVRITELTRTFDVWFDNVFSDWSVRNRIAEATGRIDQLVGWLDEMQSHLDGETRRVAAELEAIERERQSLRSF